MCVISGSIVWLFRGFRWRRSRHSNPFFSLRLLLLSTNVGVLFFAPSAKHFFSQSSLFARVQGDFPLAALNVDYTSFPNEFPFRAADPREKEKNKEGWSVASASSSVFMFFFGPFSCSVFVCTIHSVEWWWKADSSPLKLAIPIFKHYNVESFVTFSYKIYSNRKIEYQLN